MPLHRERTFTVEGITPFPLDMLRYDSCFPVDSESVLAISQSMDALCERPQGRVYRVRLMSRALHTPTQGRWSSFLWKVID